MADGFDMKELDDFSKNLLKLGTEKMPKESRKFLQTEGNKLKKEAKNKGKSKVKKDSGNYEKGWKRGKVYKYQGEDLSIRVYNSSPHAHLIEYGHRIVDKNGIEKGFKKGEFVLEEVTKEFENSYYNDVENFIDDLLDKGL